MAGKLVYCLELGTEKDDKRRLTMMVVVVVTKKYSINPVHSINVPAENKRALDHCGGLAAVLRRRRWLLAFNRNHRNRPRHR